MTSERSFSPWTYYAATALSLSVGWGIRGNFGHEYGAMIPGALAALSVCLMSGRPDWHAGSADFALFGALGWSFGGSMSYMQVVAYTHSGHSPSVLYGFACLFVIGFLWAAPGGAGTAMPAVAGTRRFLSDLFLPMSVVFCPLVAAGGGDRAVAPVPRLSSSTGTIPTGWRRSWRSSPGC